MKVSVFGLGYVGCVSIGCLAREGLEVIGVDVNPDKVALVNSGQSTIVEKGLDSLIADGVEQGRISATTSPELAITGSDIAILCVGTPNLPAGHLDMQYILKVGEEVGAALRYKESFFTIAIRSTVMPGTNQKLIEIVEMASGKQHDVDFAVVSNPEFLREGNAVSDFFAPPYTVIGTISNKGASVVQELYSFLGCPVFKVDVQIAELIKFLNNTFHALKVAFANEVGRLCKELNVDSHDLMELFVSDTELNISSRYFRPGFSYGGSCLPKDLKALQAIAHDCYLELPILQSVDQSNRINTNSVYNRILEAGCTRIGVYGLSFKEGTDDLRFSPSLELVERLIGKGGQIRVYDKNVNMSRLVGKNKEFLFNHLPHVDKTLCASLEELLQQSDMLLITQIVPEEDTKLIKDFVAKNSMKLLDLTRTKSLEDVETYEGISW
jgi:GDP-mannose 6-dehydrogenase